MVESEDCNFVPGISSKAFFLQSVKVITEFKQDFSFKLLGLILNRLTSTVSTIKNLKVFKGIQLLRAT